MRKSQSHFSHLKDMNAEANILQVLKRSEIAFWGEC